jgi:arginase
MGSGARYHVAQVMMQPTPPEPSSDLGGRVALLGVPLDENSSFLRGCARGPARVRELLASGASNMCAEDGTDLGAPGSGLLDAGDVELTGTGAEAMTCVEEAVAALLARGARVLALGGDHSITYPSLRAHARRLPDLGVLHFDAHPDLYHEFQGNRFSHASPFARIMEEGLARRLVQVGIRTLNPHQREQARRFGVEIVEMRELRPGLRFDFEGPVYVSVDLDALDPAFAPGVSHHEPGGLSVRELLDVLRLSRLNVVGADVVELNPVRDPLGITAAVAAKLVKELAARILAGEGP